MRRGQLSFSIFAVLLTLVVPPRAFASPVENFFELQLGSGDAQHMLLRYINGGGGLFVTSDGGQNWQLQCDSSMLEPLAEVLGPTAVIDSGYLVLTTTGVMKAELSGCGWHVESPELTKSIQDFAVHPGDRSQVFAVYAEVKGGDQHGGILRRAADGVWSELGTRDDRYPVSVRAAVVNGALRIYEVAALPALSSDPDAGFAPLEYVVRVSDDEGKSFREHALKMVNGGLPQVRAIDPANPDRIVVAISRVGSEPDDVLVSSDQGANFTLYTQVTTFNELVFGKDGEVWIGDMGVIDSATAPKGLLRAKSLTEAPTRVSDYPVQCLGYRAKDDTLFACQHFWFGTVNQADATFTTTMRMSSVKEFVQCPGADPVAACQNQLCLAYCGSGHFAVAPVCWSYDMPNCGVPIAREEGATFDSAGGGGTGGNSGSTAAGSGGRVAPATAGRSAAGSRAAAGSGGAAGSAGTGSSGGDGCNCELAGARRSGGAGSALTLGALALVFARMRRRSRS